MNYYIQGNKEKADQIKAAFEKLGIASNADRYNYKNDNVLYFTAGGMIHMIDANGAWANIIKTHPDYKELELPVESKFKVGSWLYHNSNGVHPVLVTDYDERHGYQIQDGSGRYHLSRNLTENEYHLWTIQDAKDGDILVTTKVRSCPFIYRKTSYNNNLAYYYAGIDGNGNFCEGCLKRTLFHFGSVENVVPATKEQRALLFKKMHEAGYQWYAGRKELCKIIEPKFKVGDDIKIGNIIETIAEVAHAIRKYYCESGMTISFENQDLWHLVPKPHYDIANFKPFDKVLVRCSNDEEWMIEFYCKYDTLVHTSPHRDYPFMGIGDSYSQCIPFEGNEHLLGTTDMPSEEYINW